MDKCAVFFLLVVLQIWEMTIPGVLVVGARFDRRCPPCPSTGCPVPTNCEYGVLVDNCGRSTCAKGPGERCKIKRFRTQGECGDGTYCICGFCTGCSLFTYECFETTCAINVRITREMIRLECLKRLKPLGERERDPDLTTKSASSKGQSCFF